MIDYVQIFIWNAGWKMMEHKTRTDKFKSLPLRIGIIGAGFSGTALAAACYRLRSAPVEIILFDKTGCFGTGEAYSSPFPFHLLNVRARDMSAFEDEPLHFAHWLKYKGDIVSYLDEALPIEEQFAPRFLYGHYLKQLLKTMQSDSSGKLTLKLEPAEVIDVIPKDDRAILILHDHREITVDKVVLATGNNPVMDFPFPVSSEVNCIPNPWDYQAPKQIPSHDPVCILGSGLSMIDAVLTLYYQQHQGKIYAVSRHGLLPLSHADINVPYLFMQEQLPLELRSLTTYLRSKSRHHSKEGGDWRSVINALRVHIPVLWGRSSLKDRKRFLRHVLPYWNIHRHRVHHKVADLLAQLMAQQQLEVMAGRVIDVENGFANVKLRHFHQSTHIAIKWLINCMGPSLTMASQPSLVHSLVRRSMVSVDPLGLGFDMMATGALREPSGQASSLLYTIGPPAKGAFWECGAVPEIRKQSFGLAKHLLGTN
jgi:uncharacterized NAD(P)/FAD-binding protein YdhS